MCYEVGKRHPNVVLIATDVFGHTFPNVSANADTIAAAGFRVLIPDLVEGDPVLNPRMEQPGGGEFVRTQ
jgi:dienelactone hydrolase